MSQSLEITNSFKYELQSINYETNFNAHNEAKGSTSNLHSFNYSEFNSLPQSFTFKKPIDDTHTRGSFRFHNLKEDSGTNMEVPWTETSSAKSQKKFRDTNLSQIHSIEDKLQINEQYKKNKCGLRELSLKVKNIVNQKGKSTYKEVAQLLVANYRIQMKNSIVSDEQLKQQKNIRRRVYDALNVLVSSGIFQKRDKFVCSTIESRMSGKKLIEKFDSIKQIEKEERVVKNSKNNKLKILKHLSRKYFSFRKLLARNKTTNEKEFLQSYKNEEIEKYLHVENPQNIRQAEPIYDKQESKKKIYFPLVFLKYNLCQNDIQLILDKESNDLNIKSVKEIKLEGDLDLIMKLQWKGRDGTDVCCLERQINEIIEHNKLII